jgi:hypothetical protein
MNNKFEFSKLLLTDEVLDVLGFSPYWDEHCVWGIRSLNFENNTHLTLADYEEMFDDTEGNWHEGTYIAHHFSFYPSKSKLEVNESIDYWGDTFFLHELYDIIEFYYPSQLINFISNCKKNNMKIYIEQYIKYKEKLLTK